MNIAIGDFLKNMVQNEGTEYLLEEARVCACLADMFPKFKRERSILRMSIRMGYPLKLEQSIKDLGLDNSNLVIRKLAQEFCDEGWVTHEAALYALNILAYAKGYVKEFAEPEVAFDTKYFEHLSEKVNLLEKENHMLQKQNDILQKKSQKQTTSSYDDMIRNNWQYFINDEDITLIKAITKKDPKLMVKCGKLFLTSQNIETATLGEDLLLTAAEKEVAEAQLLLGELYYRNKDEGRAYIWFQRSANNGDANAAYKLGIMFGMSGRYVDAVKWFKLAAEGGVAEAQLQYGILLQSGMGIEKNQQLALYWFQKSANAGNEVAIEKYHNLIKIMNK